VAVVKTGVSVFTLAIGGEDGGTSAGGLAGLENLARRFGSVKTRHKYNPDDRFNPHFAMASDSMNRKMAA
jgi:hypothetical protein